jgi:hypothetical protein
VEDVTARQEQALLAELLKSDKKHHRLYVFPKDLRHVVSEKIWEEKIRGWGNLCLVVLPVIKEPRGNAVTLGSDTKMAS